MKNLILKKFIFSVLLLCVFNACSARTTEYFNTSNYNGAVNIQDVDGDGNDFDSDVWFFDMNMFKINPFD